MPVPTMRLQGNVYGRLTVKGIAPRHLWRNYGSHWICVCQCGTEKIINGSDLKSGNVNSCGCLLKEFNHERLKVHGNSCHPLYRRWQQMLARCDNKNIPNYRKYGARGIKVCERWYQFENFVADMGDPPSPKHSLDRIDNEGDYCKENCRWATASEQQLNKRNSLRNRYKNGNGHIVQECFCFA